MPAYARPADLKTVLSLMADGTWRVLAGGTDLYPGAGATLAGPVLDITSVSGLRGFTAGNGLCIGAATSWAAIAEAELPPALAGLQQAARQIGARQVQNAGTIGGNLCNASPAADGVPPLLTLDAEVELASAAGVRRMALADFLQGPRRTCRASNEVMTAVHIPAAALHGQATFLKLGARAYMVISIAMVATRIVSEGGVVTDIALSVGACSPVAQRLPLVEKALIGAPLARMAELVRATDVAASLAPIDDVRAPSDYRLLAAVELIRRAVGGVQ